MKLLSSLNLRAVSEVGCPFHPHHGHPSAEREREGMEGRREREREEDEDEEEKKGGKMVEREWEKNGKLIKTCSSPN